MFDQGKSVHIKTQKRNFGALDLQENTLIVSNHNLLKRPKTPDLNDYLKEYFDEYENRQNDTFTTASFADLSPFQASHKNVKPSSLLMEETPTKPRGKENYNRQVLDDAQFTKEVDDMINRAQKLNFSITGETELIPRPQKRDSIPQKTTPRNRVTFAAGNDTNEINTVRLNDFFSAKKDELIDFDNVEKTEEQISILKKPTQRELQRKPLQRINPYESHERKSQQQQQSQQQERTQAFSVSRGSFLLTQNLSTSTLPHISVSNIDKFMSVTGLNNPVKYSTMLDITGSVSNQLYALFEQKISELKQRNGELKRINSSVIDEMTENTPALMVDFLSMSQQESSQVKEKLQTLKQQYSNEAITELLENEIELERMWFTQQQQIAQISSPLKTALKKSTDQSLKLHYTEKDLKNKQAEIARQKSKKEDCINKRNYEDLLSILPFKVKNLRTKTEVPKATITEKSGKRTTTNTNTAKPILMKVAQNTRNQQLKNEINELLTVAPDLLFDGKILSFLISSTNPSVIRFAVTVRIPPSYPWCRLQVLAVRQDIVSSDVTTTVKNIAANLPFGPNLLLNFYHTLNSTFCSDF